MYKKASQFQQYQASVVKPKNVSAYFPDWDEWTDADKRSALVRVFKGKAQELAQVKLKKPYVRGAEERDQYNRRVEFLGAELANLQAEINKLRPKRKGSKDIVDFYITAAKDICGEFMHRHIMDKAHILFEQYKKDEKEKNSN